MINNNVKVKAGDTLWGIYTRPKDQGGFGLTSEQAADAIAKNKQNLKNQNLIHVGDLINNPILDEYVNNSGTSTPTEQKKSTTIIDVAVNIAKQITSKITQVLTGNLNASDVKNEKDKIVGDINNAAGQAVKNAKAAYGDYKADLQVAVSLYDKFKNNGGHLTRSEFNDLFTSIENAQINLQNCREFLGKSRNLSQLAVNLNDMQIIVDIDPTADRTTILDTAMKKEDEIVNNTPKKDLASTETIKLLAQIETSLKAIAGDNETLKGMVANHTAELSQNIADRLDPKDPTNTDSSYAETFVTTVVTLRELFGVKSDLTEKVLQILTEVRTEQINAKLKALALKVEQEAIDNKIADKNKEAKKLEDKKLTNGQIKKMIRQGLTNDKISELLKKETFNEFHQKNQ